MSPRAWFPGLVLAATLAELVAAAVLGPDRFAGFGWSVRSVLYPALMLVAPLAWWLSRGRGGLGSAPYAAFGLVMLPFLSDVTGTWLDLFARVEWWDEATHFGHWFLLGAGLGLLMAPHVRPRWVLLPLVAGLGALLAVAWELLEWLLFYRDRGGPYEDTLGDLALGTSGAFLAGFLVLMATLAAARRDAGAAPAGVRTHYHPT